MLGRMKDPERVRLGRLGGLTTAARGHHNTSPGREAWLRRLAEEFGITDDLEPAEKERRMAAALRLRMARIARSRWDRERRLRGW